MRRNYWAQLAVAALLAAQCLQIAVTVHRESLTWDEGNHMYAGYRMWKSGDFGLNPEHPAGEATRHLAVAAAASPRAHSVYRWLEPQKLDPQRRADYVKQIEDSVKKL